MRRQLDVAKKKCPFKYKIAIMLLHIHKFLLRAYHSMQSTLPYRHGSRGGALQQQWEEATLTPVQDGKGFTGSVQLAYKMHGSFHRANYIKIKCFKNLTSWGQVAENGNFTLGLSSIRIEIDSSLSHLKT